MPVEKEVEVVLKFPETENLSPPILQLDELSFWYGPERVIFNNVNLGATMESRICIVSLHQLCATRKLIHNLHASGW
jgi:ATP-binding cassette, subfamily F, member 3